MLLLIGAFFAVCVGYVWWCDRIIGPDAVEPSAADDVVEPVEGVGVPR